MAASALIPSDVSVQSVTLARGSRTLVRDLSFEVAPGEAVELRGPNGSGKTTLLRALAGLHAPRAGTIAIGGEAGEARADRLHLLGHLDAIKAADPVRRQLAFAADLYGADRGGIAGAVDRLGLARLLDLPGASLSAGQRRRLALARLLVAPRPVWLLDEPAAPLDAAGRTLLGEIIDAHRATGGIVIAAVHDALPGAQARKLELGA
jgi:heme exporter protein A